MYSKKIFQTEWVLIGVISSLLLLPSTGWAGESRAVIVDGRYSDWAGAPATYSDASGDAGSSGIDIGRVWLANSGEHLYFRFELGQEKNLQADNSLVLYLDTDNSASTGRWVGNIGAEISYRFGSRVGFLHATSGDQLYLGGEIGLVSAPTVSSQEFELEIRRDATVAGESVFRGSSFRWLLRDEESSGGDWAPNNGQTASYTFDETAIPAVVPISLLKDQPDAIRVVSYNTLFAGLFDEERSEHFDRIIQSLNPDVINFQEIYDQSAEEVVQKLEQLLPSGPGESWYGAKNYDTISVSRFPVAYSKGIDANLAVVFDLPQPGYPAQLMIVNAHPPCCENDVARQAEVDAIMGFLREAKEAGGELTLQPGTPILIVGDMNFVGLSNQLTTLLTGDIADEGEYGPDFAPDWDGTSLADACPRHTAEREVYTWQEAGNSYTPGRLDFIIYSDSVFSIAKAFVLRTEGMAVTDRQAAGLEIDDTSLASDHLPVVADFVVREDGAAGWMVY